MPKLGHLLEFVCNRSWIQELPLSLSSGGLNLATFFSFLAITVIASKSTLEAFEGLIRFAVHWRMPRGFTESSLFVQWYWKQSETGCQLSPSVLTLWSFSAEKRSSFSCNLSNILFMITLFLLVCFRMWCSQAFSRVSVTFWRILLVCSPVSVPPR